MSSPSEILGKGKHWGVVVLSLVPTPLLVFLSPASALYLRNQLQLQHQPQVLIPFGLLLVLAIVLGLLLRALSRFRMVRFCLTGYYVLGPLFLFFAFFRNQLTLAPFLARFYQTAAGLWLWPILLLTGSVAAHLWMRSQTRIRISAVLGVCLLAADGVSFYLHFESRGSSRLGPIPASLTHDSDPSLPNIYHLILDGFQTDFFERALTPEGKKTLAGFTFYPANTSIYHTTFMSLASVFSARKYAYDRPQYAYLNEAFNSRVSVLHWLKKEGYSTQAYLPRAGLPEAERTTPSQLAGLLDRIVLHDYHVDKGMIGVNAVALWNLWLYSTLPDPLREAAGRGNWLTGLEQEDLGLLKKQRLLNRSAQVASYRSFQNILREEPQLSNSNRYTLIHLLIPHWPYNLRVDCSFKSDGRTGPVEQSLCALKLIDDFLSLLKRLGRFDRSLILIHGDHGAFYRVRNGSLKFVERSRSSNALLLIKPLGRNTQHPLETSGATTTLLDIKPILLRSVAGYRAGGSSSNPVPDHQGRLTPYIEGETLRSAQLILQRQGFTIGRVLAAHNRRYATGKVIAQDPPPYQEADRLKQVAVLVSLGNCEDANLMPDFVGRNISEVIDDVIERARNGSFPQARIHYVEHGSAPTGTVVAQSPPAQTEIDKDYRISIYISKFR